MITPNIDALSLGELQYIARKQGLDDAEVLDREELLEALQELYEEQENSLHGEGISYAPSAQQRFMNTLVEHESDASLGLLPGVQRLPETYCETRIHLLFKDPYWAHAYWSVCPADLQRLEQSSEDFSLFLRVAVHESADRLRPADSVDIQVMTTDISWNINLPERGRTYSVSLHYRDGNGNGGMLCQSDTVRTPKSYWIEHSRTLGEDEKTFTLLFSSLVSKGGVMVEDPLLREVIEHLDARMGG